jgi:alpha-beta hydrolase superfamily lysophospholipase
VDSQTAVLTFNNRGHDKVAVVPTEKGRRLTAGSAHEVFTDCIDDINGALNFVRRKGVSNIFLAGHSTGCQKSVYWASKSGAKIVKGIIILAPMSDYAAELHTGGKEKLARAEKVAREYVRTGRKHELLPDTIWNPKWLADAQRYISAYSGNSPEEIFTYWDRKRTPRTLRSVKRPLLTVLAEKDEYSDRPVEELYEWFLEHTYEGEVAIVPKAMHGFKGGERKAASLIKNFMKEYLQ